MKKRFSISTVCALMLLIAAATFTITFVQVKDFFNSQLNITAEQQAEIKKYLEAKENIENSFVGEIDPAVLMDMSIAGMVQGLGDGESYYLDREGYARYKESGKYAGVGLICDYDAARGALVITSVLEGSPAKEAGIGEFDVIVSADGKTVVHSGYNAVIEALSGEEGTTVDISIITASGVRRSLELIRRQINAEAVHSEILDGNIGYMRITNFDSGAGADFKDSVGNLVGAGVRGIIFDVRFNIGGKRQELTSVLDTLIGEGVILVTGDKDGGREEITSDSAQIDLPMAVIVNGYTANAAEYFAAVLQESGKAMVIGQNTPGNGYVLVPVALNDDSAIILSTREYITPGGKKLVNAGVVPDVQVEMSLYNTEHFSTMERENDRQLIKAVEAVELLIAIS